MKPIDNNDIDKMILLLQRELHKNEKHKKSSMRQPYHGPGFLIDLPVGFDREEDGKTSVIYYSKNRPDIIFLQEDGHAGITFLVMDQEHDYPGYDMETRKKVICEVLKREDTKTVFYEEGKTIGDVSVLWFDYKSFASNEVVYNIMFLFQTAENWIIGTFYCIFKDYDLWKWEVLNMLHTIQLEEASYERV